MQKFKKSERLCSRKSIGQLFSSGNTLFHYPFRLVWMDIDHETPFPVQLAISVPRKKFKNAVDRNHIKRLIRESFRLNKDVLYKELEKKNRKVQMMLLYISTEKYDFNKINCRLRQLIQKFIDDDTPCKDAS